MFNLLLTNNLFINILLILNYIFLSIFPIFYLTQNIYALVSIIKKPKQLPKAKKMHKFGYVICCHNEERVIGNLLDSITKQNYPKELQEIFVILDNCSDLSGEIALKYNSHIIERNDLTKIGKSYALDYGLKEIKEKYENLNCEAYLFFDADNLLDNNYTLKMNQSLDSGILVSTSLRKSQNADKNLLTASSSLCFLRECMIVHRGRKALKVGTYVSGTGFYVSKEVLERFQGYPFHLLIEDIEFSIYCANNKIKIGYNEEAIFYDEQPENFKDFYHQRLRWTRGNHQCYFKYAKSLNKTFFKTGNPSALEMLLHTFPFPAFVILFNLLELIITGVYSLVLGLSFKDFYNLGLNAILKYYLILFIMIWVHAIITLILSRKILKGEKKKYLAAFFFPIYLFSLILISVISLFKKVKWQKIEHKTNLKIDDLKEV